MKINRIALGAVMIAALCAGIWFFALPSLNRQADLEQQADLLDSVMAHLPAYAAVESDLDMEIPVQENESFISDEIRAFTESIGLEAFTPVEPEMPTTAPETLEPLDQTDFPSGITPIGILSIDSIDLRLPVMEGVDSEQLKIAPGRVMQTANIGEIGNAVIAGHRNYTYGSMFNRLGEVENGDIIEFQAMSGEKMAFEVFEILVITPDNQITFIQPQHESIITLYTCTPVRVATHRLIIRAKIIEGGL